MNEYEKNVLDFLGDEPEVNEKIKLYQGNNLDVLKTFEDNSIDSIVTDPPAGISFMNKGWDHDKGGRNEWIKWLSEVMTESKRTLKPGGHMFVWALPRTSHWTATACEDAGFEIRDVVVHVFGSGFPKSFNIKKNIEKKWNKKLENVKNVEQNFYPRNITMDGQNFVQGNVLVKVKEQEKIEFVKIVDQNFMFHQYIQQEQIDQAEFFVVWNVRQNIKNNSQAILTQIGKVEDLNGKMDMSQLELVEENIDLNTTSLWKNILEGNLNEMKKYTISTLLEMITELKTLNYSLNPNMLKNISCLGTGLKPASEHWILCRKPISEKTIADNVLKWGTGGLNIDKSRIATEDNLNERYKYSFLDNKGSFVNSDELNPERFEKERKIRDSSYEHEGRFPANLIHDGSDEVMEEFAKAGNRKSSPYPEHKLNKTSESYNWNQSENVMKEGGYNDEGSAARFFYCSKASGKEKNEGLIDCKSTHPTVKPIKLMSYLINMITPVNGIVLDPFMGSGSTGVAALLNNFNFIGIELDPEYFKIAEARINSYKAYEKL